MSPWSALDSSCSITPGVKRFAKHAIPFTVAAARLRAAAGKRNPFACLPQENTFDGLDYGTLATTEQSLDEQADDEDGGRELDGVTQYLKAAAGARAQTVLCTSTKCPCCRLTIVERHGATPGAQTVLCNPTSQDAG